MYAKRDRGVGSFSLFPFSSFFPFFARGTYTRKEKREWSFRGSRMKEEGRKREDAYGRPCQSIKMLPCVRTCNKQKQKQQQPHLNTACPCRLLSVFLLLLLLLPLAFFAFIIYPNVFLFLRINRITLERLGKREAKFSEFPINLESNIFTFYLRERDSCI